MKWQVYIYKLASFFDDASALFDAPKKIIKYKNGMWYHIFSCYVTDDSRFMSRVQLGYLVEVLKYVIWNGETNEENITLEC